MYSIGRFLFAVSITSLAASLPGAIITVDPAGGAQFTEIQPALDAAGDTDTVLVLAGEYVLTSPLSFNRLHDPANPASPPLKNIKLESDAGPSRTILRLSATPADLLRASIIVFDKGEGSSSLIEGFRIIGGAGTRWGPAEAQYGGGGILCVGSSPSLSGCTILGNTASRGGGIACVAGSKLTLSSCTFSGNGARTEGGGVFCADSELILRSCLFSGNAAETGGAIASSSSTVRLVQCTVAGNASWLFAGGGLSLAGKPATLISCIVWSNSGGAIAHDDASAPAVGFSCIEGPSVWPGTGNINADPLFCGWGQRTEVFADAAHVGRGDGSQANPFRDLADALRYNFDLPATSPCIGTGKDGDNMGTDRGTCESPGIQSLPVHVAAGTYAGVIWNLAMGKPRVEGAGIGATLLEGTVVGLRTGASLSRLTVREGSLGGVLVSAHESPAIDHCSLEENRGPGLGASGEGDGATGEGSALTLLDCTFLRNAGFGVALGSKAKLERCTIAQNEKGIDPSPETLLLACEVRGNAGAGIASDEGSFTDARACVIIGNGAAGIELVQSAAVLTNCIIAGNKGAGVASGLMGDAKSVNCTVTANSGQGILCGGPSCKTEAVNCIVRANGVLGLGGAGSNNLVDIDPRFVKAGRFDFTRFATVDVGGATVQMPDFVVEAPDHRLQPGSPAIDAGTSAGAPLVDLENHARPCGRAVDIGAYEAGCAPAATQFIRGDANADSRANIADAIFILGHLFRGAAAPSCRKTADTDDTGTVNLTDPIHLLQHLFRGGPPLKSPFPACGPDPTNDALSCNSFTPCP